MKQRVTFTVKKTPAALSLALLTGGGAVAGFAVASLLHMGGGASTPVSLTQAQAIVGKLTHQAARVTRVFPGPAGLTGLVIEGKQGPVVSWMTDSRSAVIVGGVVDTKTNKNLTVQANIQYVLSNQATLRDKPTAQTEPAGALSTPKPMLAADVPMQGLPHGVPQPSQGASLPAASPSQGATQKKDGEFWLRQFLRESQSGTMVQVSQPGWTGPHTLYAFVDPNCIFCHKLFDEVQKDRAEFRKAGVRVVYVPVAILKQSSIAKAAEIAKEGWTALLKDERGFNESSEEGGLAGLSGSALSQYAQTIRGNTDWLKNLSTANHAGEGTPFLVWQAGNGRAYFLDGFPDEQGLRALFASLQPGWSPEKAVGTS